MEPYKLSPEQLKKLGYAETGTPSHFIWPKYYLNPYQDYGPPISKQTRGVKYWKQSI